MTLYFTPWQLVAVCVLTVIGASVVALVVVGLIGRLIFGPAARTVDQALADVAADEPSNVLPYRDPRHNPLTCRECLGVDRGGVS